MTLEDASNEPLEAPQVSEVPENATGTQDTGESPDIQQKAESKDTVNLSEAVPGRDQPEPAPHKEDKSASNAPKWVQLLDDFHNNFNGLLAGKENLKLVAVNLDAEPSFYRKWSLEANQVMRLTSSLRRRSVAAKIKFK